MSKRILILYTGGTIGMQRSPQGYVPFGGLQQLIDLKIPPRLAVDMPKYDMLEYSHLIDSSNVEPDDWRQMAQDIADNYEKYDGFVVLHGTDTMAYTASALSFLLQGLTKPVIVTGSQIPLAELRNDAQNNLVTAIELASSFVLPEVCLYFNGYLLRGNRCRKLKATGFDAFNSPNYPKLGQVGIYISLNHQHVLPMPASTNFQLLQYQPSVVRMLSIYPGIEGEIIDALARSPCRALILRTYGVGNGPSQNGGFIDALKRARDKGIVLVNLSQCPKGKVAADSYAAGSALAAAGLISGVDMTPEAAFTKLHHLCAMNLDSAEMERRIGVPLAGEISPA